MKKITLLKAFFLLCALVVGSSSSWADTKTETFESKTTSQTYNSTVTINTNESSCGIAWSIYYGTVSTNDKISGSNSAQMRWYANASSNYPYAKTTTAIDNLTKVDLKARTSNTNVKLEVSYSADGDSWTSGLTYTFSEADKGESVSLNIPEGNKYVKFGVSSSSTKPSSGNYKLIIDDVVFTYTSKVATVTTISDASITNTDLKNGLDAGALTASVTAGGTPIVGAEVTWSSSDEEVATIDPATGAVTLVGEGTTTMTASYSENASYLESSDTYDLTVSDTRTATITTINSTGITNTDLVNGTAAGTLTASVTAGGTPVVGAEVTWTSSDPTVATVNETTGVVTLVKAGSTTITATYAGTNEYKTSSTSYVLSVTNSSQAKEVEISLNNSLFGTSYDGGLSSDEKTALRNAGGYIEGTNNNVTVRYSIGTSSNFYVNNEQIRTYDKTNIVVTAPSGFYLTSIEFVEPESGKSWGGTHTSNPAGYNGSSKKWTGASSAVTINFGGTCRMVGINVTLAQIATISLNALCNDGEGNIYGTYSNAKAFVVPADLTVSAVGISEGKLVVTNYETGNIVKANTGVMVKAVSSVDVNKTILLSDETGTEIPGNLLKASSVAMTGDNLFYRLTMHNPATDNKIGFWWGAANGAAFDIAANKAYLAVPTGALAKEGFTFEDTTTGINGVEDIAPVTKTRKVVKNGRLVIETANGEFTIDGARVK